MRKSGYCKQLSLSVARSGPAGAETLVYGTKQRPKSHVESIPRRQLLSACGHVCFSEFIFHFSLFFLPYCPSSIIWILKCVCERTSAHYSHVSLASPYDKNSTKMKLSLGHCCNYTDRKTAVLGEKPAPVPLCPPQIWRRLPRKAWSPSE